ncbi:MAG: AAA family ATPase, partial [Nitrospirota bacterium]|nr:AAA family ATPase [Nitrospirota bacterium]
MIGDLVGEGVRSDEVVGKTPNLAARLQALAKPHCMVVAPATRRLIGDLFETEDLGLHEFKGLPEPVRAYRVEAESSAVSRFEALCGARMTPLIGRDNEVRLLLDRWAHASEGEGQIVLLSAEPGIGKSRIVRALRDSLADRPHVSLSHYCSPFHANTVLHPVIEHLQRVLGLERDDSAETKLAKLEARLAPANRYPKDAVPLVASLLGVSIGDSHPPLDLKPQEQQRRTLELLVERVEVLAAEQPVLVVYEDVQWADPSTLQMLTLLIKQVETLPVLVVITSRPDFASPWAGYGHITQLSLTRLTRRHGGAVMQHVAGDKALPAEVAEQILTHADGVPLFIEELTKAVLESGFLRDSGDR